MDPQFSEFSYGFALTYELVNAWTGMGITVAPSFPSLYQEGKPGGGYDVRWDLPGFPLILQFKISQYMKRRTAGEWKQFGAPYYRFWMHGRRHSDQHDLLLSLDDGTADVYYAAPRIHKTDALNRAFYTGGVRNSSIFFRPTDIGSFADDDGHCIAFRPNEGFGFRFSEPVRVRAVVEGSSSTQVLLARMRERRPTRPEEYFERIVRILESKAAVRAQVRVSDGITHRGDWPLAAQANYLVRTVLGAELVWAIDETRLDSQSQNRLRAARAET